MTTEQAVDKLLAEYRAGESWRPHFERIVNNLTDGANSINKETFELIQQYFRNMR